MKQRRMILRILASAALYLAARLLDLPGVLGFLSYLVPYLLIGWDVLWAALRSIAHGQIFDENFLMALASAGAMGIREYPEAVAVLLFYQVGELFQSYAVGKSRKSIAELMDIRPDSANLERDGELIQENPQNVPIGSVIVVRPGERVPLDGTVIEGHSSLDTAALTGESAPRDVAPGDAIFSGCVNHGGVLRVKTEKGFFESTASRILDLVENASEKKARAENFITRFARYYTPFVVISAALLALIPPLFFGDFNAWLHRALTFLVISCPCALVISVPLSFFGGIGAASKRGILVKGGNYLEALSHASCFVFDKTGTLTEGRFRVASVHPVGISADALLEYAALAEHFSSHPIALCIREACKSDPDPARVAQIEELPGRGISAQVDGLPLLLGNERLLTEHKIQTEPANQPGTILHAALQGRYLGHIIIADAIKPEAKESLADLKRMGVQSNVMLTGDGPEVAREVAEALGIDAFEAALMPQDKVAHVERLLQEKPHGRTLCFVGDGINDAPVLSRADVGIAMGALGSDAAIEAADIVLMRDRLSDLPLAIGIAKRTIRIANQNIVFALGVKLAVLVLGALGIANMWGAVFADVGVSVLAILNAMRALRSTC